MAIAIILLFSSCPASMPSIPSSSDRPYLDPAMPGKLTVQSGLRNQFVLDWDDVEGADFYIIEYASADQPSEFKRAGRSSESSIVITGRNGSGGINIDPDQSYYFSVKAVSVFGTEYRYSVPSDIVEGAMAPENIQFLVFPTANDVTLVWHSPNQISYDGDFLYNAEYRVRYRKSGTDEWAQEIRGTERIGLIWDTVKLGINKYGLEYNENYDFQVVMTIEGESPVEVESSIVTTTISENYNPDPISSYTIESDRSDYIGVEWTVPKWANGTLSEDIVFFRIERSIAGQDEWMELLDEIDDGHSELVSHLSGDGIENPLVFSYKDTSAELGVDYIYRITNCVALSPDIPDTYYITEPESTSEAGHLFYPEIETATAEYTMQGPAKAEVSLSFATNAVLSDNLNLKWGVKKTVIHPDLDEAEEIILDDLTPDGNKFTFTEVLGSNDKCSNRSHEYSYTLLLLRTDDSIYCTLDSFKGEPLVLDNPPLLDGGIITENNRVGRIAFNWRVLSDYDDVKPEEYEFSYSFGDGPKQIIPNESINISDDGLYSFDFETEETELAVLKLYVSAMDEQYYSVAATNARILAFPDDFDVSATLSDYPDKIQLSWNSAGVITNSVGYGYQYKIGDAEDWITAVSPITVTDNKVDFERGEIPQDAEITFRITAQNNNYPDEGFAVSSETVGRFFSAPENIKATKGHYSDKVIVSWDVSEKADSYTVYRYSQPDFSDAVEAASYLTDTTYNDDSFDSSKPYYTVAAVNSNGMTEKQDSFGTMINEFKETEPDNMGYLLGSVIDASVRTAEMDSNGYYKPYTVVTWKRVPGATKYTISALGDSITVNVTGESGYDHTSSFTAGTPDSVGFLSYDGVDTYTYFDNTGTLRDTLDVSGYSIMASSEFDATDAKSMDNSVRRQLKAVEYVNLLNNALQENLSKVGFSDWWTGPWGLGSDGDTKQNSYAPDNGFEVCSADGTALEPEKAPTQGYIKLTSFMPYGNDLIFNSRTGSSGNDIRILPSDNDGAGYLDIDKLNYIGYDNRSDDTGKQGFVDITSDVYGSITIQLHNINVQSIDTSGNAYYIVTINNGNPEKILDSESIVRPY